MKIITVCCHCKTGGENGPLLKIGKNDYAHNKCLLEKGMPKISNSSIAQVPDDKEIRQIVKEAKRQAAESQEK